MVASSSVPLRVDGSMEQKSGDGLVQDLLSPAPLKTPSIPLSLRLFRHKSIRRNYSITATITVPGRIHTTIPAARFDISGPALTSVMPHDERPLGANSDPATQDFQGDVKVSTALPSESTLERIADLPVFDVDGKTVPFKSLYWSNGNESKKVMIIFIRHFFCGVSVVDIPCVQRGMTKNRLELPGVSAHPCCSDSSFFSAPKYINPHHWLRLAHSNSIIHRTDTMSVPDLC